MKVSGPKVDPETKRREEQAAKRAEASKERETKGRLSEDTAELMRIFGARALSGLFGGLPTSGGAGVVAGGSGAGTSGGGSFLTSLLAQGLASPLGGGSGGLTRADIGGA